MTKPYTEAQWQGILSMGTRVDRALRAGDVRLTMGGEPTFVAHTGTDAPEWNTDAMGPTKRHYAGALMRKLATLWAPGHALVHAQGKQYPGEQLPRWALHAFWREDGEPVWRDHALLADPDRDRDTADADAAAAFAKALAERLQVDPASTMPGHEDVHYYLWREQRLPANVVGEDSRLADGLERARLAKVYAQGLAAPVGTVLPLRRRPGSSTTGRWQTGRWSFRDGVMFLVPGDSPMGLRLPLASLPWADPDELEPEFDPDPFADRGPLPHRASLRPDGRMQPIAEQVLQTHRSEPGVVRTALCVEPRGGLLHVFFPPLHGVEEWIELAAAVEATAAECGRKVVLEGYLPPYDARLQRFSVTPDPGVIEVNVHPAHSWAEQVERTEQLYAAAREVGLATEKFMLDGQHVGTGGGNHVVMGAAMAADSPFLRRPDLLKSLLGFWHNHPSLSFAFAGLFIGPTSQHPRIDEARDDSVNELEIAFRQIAPFEPVPPWMTDRLLRNILADMTGNLHRTEFCIDKLYAPGSATGRLGLLEFRAFEMPPHARMALAQTLLVRAAIAAFWTHPYERRLIRWGTRLHDDFMLPYYCEQDFADGLEELAGLGYALDPAWFAPHMEFRFPQVGQIALRGMELELRHALEPWHVLGEEQSGAGTARYVDSSVERIQVKLSGWSDERYALACNGVGVPLSRTERAGERVGGVRFKAWQPPSALHPSIRAQTPLVFDVYDRFSGRSLGGVTHHASHPGGRNYETFPVNANEAEARRRARFFPIGHTPGPMREPTIPPASLGREQPRTLDLRRFA